MDVIWDDHPGIHLILLLLRLPMSSRSTNALRWALCSGSKVDKAQLDLPEGARNQFTALGSGTDPDSHRRRLVLGAHSIAAAVGWLSVRPAILESGSRAAAISPRRGRSATGTAPVPTEEDPATRHTAGRGQAGPRRGPRNGRHRS